MPAAVASRGSDPNINTPPGQDPIPYPAGSRDYPGLLLTHIWDGLAIFAILVIARYLVQSFFQRRIKRHFDRPSWPPVISPSSAQAHLLVGQQRLHSHFARGPFWTAMDEKSRGVGSTSDKAAGETTTSPGFNGPRRVGFADVEDVERAVGLEHDWQHPATGDGANSASASDHSMKGRFATRPPPPPPLTPPELSTVVFTFDDRRRNYSGAGGGFDSSFIHQPNPDYMSSTTTSASHAPGPIPSLPRRRSYTKTLPIGIPAPQNSAPMSDADLVLSPSSYPPTSPLLPPAPPGHEPAPADGAEIDVQGEVISLMDHHGAGWKRHTRVYGGGVCLACAAAGGEGGFYGDKVREEEKR